MFQHNILKAATDSKLAWGDYINDGFIDIILTGLTSKINPNDPNYHDLPLNSPSDPRVKIYMNCGGETFCEQTEIFISATQLHGAIMTMMDIWIL